jgi:hypothetical protein
MDRAMNHGATASEQRGDSADAFPLPVNVKQVAARIS